MAVNNPIKNFNFSFEVAGVIQAHIQTIQTPEVELSEITQGTAGSAPDVKTPGKKIVGELVLENTIPADGQNDSATWLWFESARTGVRASYARSGFLNELDSNGTIVAKYLCKNMWPKKIETSGYASKSDDAEDLMRTITLSIEDYIKVT